MTILRDPLLLMFACVLLGWGVYEGAQAPQVRPSTVSDNIFSADRAHQLLEELYPDRKPHVSGSPENAALRSRITSILGRFDYTAEIQSTFHCRPESASCSPVENIMAVRSGKSPGSAILLTAHYDSSWAGPGVADDGAGVAAVLEIARMASQQAGFNHDLIFLFSDGEEQGLIGADAFVSHHPLFGSVKAVINLDARGVSGPSIMFETGPGNRRVVRLLASSLERPVANSIAYDVYRHMPNDTDFSVYRARGLPGVNFAFSRGAAIYHSRIDDLDHLNPASLQHHGQNAWDMLLALEEQNLDRLPSSEDAAFIDLFGRSLLDYPASSSLGLALVIGILVIFAIRRCFLHQVTFRQVMWSLWALLLLSVALPAAGWLLSWPLGRWVDMHPLEHPYPWLGRLTLLTATLWLVIHTAKFLSARASTGSVMAACWGLDVLLAVALAYYLPVAGYVAVLPLLGFGLGLILDGFRWKKSPRLSFAGLLGLLAAAYLGFYYFFQLDAVVNFDQSAFKVLPLILPAVAALPLLIAHFEKPAGSNTFGNFLLVLVVAGCVGQHFLPGYKPDAPRNMEIMVWQEDSQPETWAVLESMPGRPDPVFARNHDFTLIDLPSLDGTHRPVFAHPIPPLELPAIAEIGRMVQNTGGQGNHRRYVLELDVPMGVRLLSFHFPRNAALRSAKVNGQLAFDASLKSRAWARERRIAVNHPLAGINRFVFEAADAKAMDITMVARYDLPEVLWQSFKDDWPGDAQPAFKGHRVLQISHLALHKD